MKLTKEEQQHYDRHLILNEISIDGQLKLKRARVLVIGAGGLGCPVLQYLTAAGVGTIGVLDDDIVTKSNLQRQILYTYNDIGTLKTDAAVMRLQHLNPFVDFKTYSIRLSKDNAIPLFKEYDIIVDGSDNFSTRYLVNDAAIITNKPVVFGSIFKFEGQVSVFNYKNGPTYRCLFPKPPKSNDVPNCSEIGVLGILPGIIGCFQANEVIKIICDIGMVLTGRLLTFNALSMQQLLFSFKKNITATITNLDIDYDVFCEIPKAITKITFEHLETLPHTYNLLDVREHWERKEHHIGGQHIPLGELPHNIDNVLQDKDLVVYCKSGVRSMAAIKILKQYGFKKQLISLSLL
ncbi:molybdopterin-synthase adenylyltransferase MoeB [Pontimicrobium sp. MEBiC01747]